MTAPTAGRVPAHQLPPSRVGAGSVAARLDRLAYAALAVLYATIPWQDVVQVPGVGTIAKAVGGAVLVVSVIALVVGRPVLRPTEPVVLVLLLTGWVVLSVLWSPDVPTSTVRATTMVQLAVLVVLTLRFARSAVRVRGLLAAFVVGDVVLALAVLQQRAGGATLVRYTAEGTNPNDVAFLMCLGIPMAWYLAIVARRRVARLATAAFPLLAILVVLLTASRSALLLLVPALAVVPLTIRLLPPRVRAGVVAVAGAAVLAVVSGAVLLPSAPLARLSTTFTELGSGTLDNRTTLWAIGLRIIEQHPWAGVGVGAVPQYVAREYPLPAGLHNTYLSVAAQVGLVGLALFLLLLLSVVRRVAAARRPERTVALVLWVVLVLGLLPRHWELSKGTWAVIALLVLVGEVFPRGTAPP